MHVTCPMNQKRSGDQINLIVPKTAPELPLRCFSSTVQMFFFLFFFQLTAILFCQTHYLSFIHLYLIRFIRTIPIPISFFPNTSFIIKSPTILLFIFDFVACLQLSNYSSPSNSRSFLHPNSSSQVSYSPVQYGRSNRTRIRYA